LAPKPLVALTGGTGFVGSHLADALVAGGWRVRALVRRPESPGWLDGRNVEITPGDVRDAVSLDAFVAGADAVIHAAGKTSAKSEAEYLAANAGGTANVVAATLRSAPAAHVVLISSQAAGGPSLDGLPVSASTPGHPVSSYGRSKLEGENEVRKATRLAYTILRPSAVYGPRETAIRDLFSAASRGVVPVLAGGKPRVQLVYVGDVVRAVLGVLRRGGRQETFYVAHPEVLDYRRIAEMLASLPAKKPLLLPVPGILIRAAGWAIGAVSAFSPGPPVFNGEKAAEMLHPAWLCYVGDAQVALGQPFETNFAYGSRLTWNWYVGMGWIRGDTIAEAERI
jgi:nucleoside-diphosphate-sugar epimerase